MHKPGELVYIYGTDILDFSQAQVIAHQCNCTSKIGKGLAKDVFERYPYANVYSLKHERIPGTIKMCGGKNKGRWVCALFAQIRPGGPSEGDDYAERKKWFRSCLANLVIIKGISSVAFPENIGCGLAKGKWEDYHQILDNFAVLNPHITVYIITQNPAPDFEATLTFDFIKELYFEMKKSGLSSLTLTELKDRHEKYEHVLRHPDEVDNVEETDIEDVDSPTWACTTLEDYTENFMPAGWEEFFKAQLDVDYGSIHELSKYLEVESHKFDVYPEIKNVYAAFRVTPDTLKVLILGQDPYFNPYQAMGIAFSVPEGIDPPPSLKNIFTELENDGFKVKNKLCGNLSKWCDQGVLLINTALTVRAHEPASHSSKWLENFTPALMRYIDEHVSEPIVVVLWGNHAQNFGKFFGERHRKIQSPHPSPLSAHRGFFGSKPFSKANHQLKLLGREIVDWNL